LEPSAQLNCSECTVALAQADRPHGPSYGWQGGLEIKLPALHAQS